MDMNDYIISTETSKQCFMNPIGRNGFADLPCSMGFFYGDNVNKEAELRPIPDFPNYFVNDLGEVWSNKKYNGRPSGELVKLKPYLNQKGYLNIDLFTGGKRHKKKVARLVVNAPPDKQVDHRNEVKSDNNISNLRLCSNSQNHMNMISNRGTSKYKGVSWHKSLKKWRALICVNFKSISLGCFEKEIEAAIAYNIGALKYHGEFARLNIIERQP
ncbi:hypothetical protein LCGC14_0351500 [marine sediment metagenome]|uniref:AP2/ERF domain-containing protein n=1 Tax=marine sediment metagenome TaxID=412755 RepID=A0A0F9VXZ5_9ZZZZ